MTDRQINDRYQAFFGADFMPRIRHDQTQGAPERAAYANEYAAFHLGQINQKLGRLIEILERSAPRIQNSISEQSTFSRYIRGQVGEQVKVDVDGKSSGEE